ncbi:MAG: DUF4010 domain-containing protein, partial [Candidatus Sulfotelmatobacter sp.]
LWMWRDRAIEQTVPGTLKLASPISLTKVLWFGTLFIAIQIAGTLLTRRFGSYGMLATGVFGGLVSSASTTAAAATLAMHGNISPALAGSTTVLASLSSAAVNLPIVWRAAKNKAVVRRLSVEVFTVVAMGVAAVVVDRVFQFSELLLRK